MAEFHFQIPEPDPSAIEAMQQAAQRSEMQWDDFRHGVQRLFEELNADQLETLGSMMRYVAQHEQCVLAGVWEGQISWERKKRFNICATCGVDHEKEAMAGLKSDPNQPPLFETGSTDPLSDLEKARDTVGPRMPQPFLERERNSDGTIPFLPQERAVMDEYHLDDQYEESGDDLHIPKFVGFACTGIEGMRGPCGYVYPSLEDRMLKSPEDCPHCHQRMMHG